MKKFYFKINLHPLTQEIEAKTEKEAVEKLRESFCDNPYPVEDLADDEIELEDIEHDCNLDEED